MGRRTKEEVADEGGDDDDEAAANIYVTSFSSTGFKLSNTYGVVGPCILFPRTILSWNVANAKDITPESLTLFSISSHNPQLERGQCQRHYARESHAFFDLLAQSSVGTWPMPKTLRPRVSRFF